MANKKDLIIAVLATFCLTAALFTVVPIRSQSTSGYDPWKDLNDDGVIDSTDLGMLGTSWATTGDPTKNVNVTNWPEDRPLTIKKGVEKVVVQDTLYSGTQLGIPGYGSVIYYYFNLETKGKLINVTELYVNIIWKADVTGTGAQPHSVYLYFINISDPWDYTYFKLGPLGPDNTIKNNCFQVSKENPAFDFSLITEGINYIYITRTDSYGNYIYIYRLEFLISYNYLG